MTIKVFTTTETMKNKGNTKEDTINLLKNWLKYPYIGDPIQDLINNQDRGVQPKESYNWLNHLPYYIKEDTKNCQIKVYLAGLTKDDIEAEIVDKELLIYQYHNKSDEESTIIAKTKLPLNFKGIKSAEMKEGLLTITYNTEEKSRKIRID